jgi:hypothetical protein
MTLFDRIFPKDEEPKASSMLVERALEALRLARDEQAVPMRTMLRVPSHFELRLAPARLQQLTGMDAVRDLEFYFRDEMMRDLAAEGMRTFGDHTIHVEVGSDPNLNENELYAVVKRPARGASGSERTRSAQEIPHTAADRPVAGEDSTRVIGEEPDDTGADADATSVLPEEPVRAPWMMSVTWSDGNNAEHDLVDPRLVIGRRGASGKPLPEGFTKFSLDLPPTISREQLQVEIDGESILVRNIGKGPVRLSDGSELPFGNSRRVALGDPIVLDTVSIIINTSGPES